MKLRLPKLLKNALLSCFIAVSAATTVASGTTLAESKQDNLGNVMYVGDSITHGFDEASYRWALFKVLADNGIGQTEKGVVTGNQSGGQAPGTLYGGRIFQNIHSSQSSARAYEVSGRLAPKNGRFGGSNIENWLGQSTEKNDGTAYPANPSSNGSIGSTFTGSNAPGTYFIMLGTNDLLSDNGANVVDLVAGKQALLIGTTTDNGATWSGGGDMDAILESIRLSNPNASVTIASIPCWAANHAINTIAQHDAVAGYNSNLEKWAKANNSYYIDVNKGLIDVASAISFCGVTNLFNADKLHPSAQGNLIIAGNIAKASGYAGRTAGQLRKASTDFAQKATGTIGAITLGTHTTAAVNETITWTGAGDVSKGYTLDFQVKVGNGGTALTPSSWNTTNPFAITLGNGVTSGTLNINEAYIQWGNTILYSMDMSTNLESLRISYVKGSSANNLAGGFYVWLGDMLIGEALSTTGNATNGVTLTYGGTEGFTLDSLSMTGGSWAPNTSLYVNPNADTHFLVGTGNSSNAGIIEWKTTGFTAENNDLKAVATGEYNARASVGGTGTEIGATITGASTGTVVSGNMFANQGAWTGNIWLTLNTLSTLTSWHGGHNNGILTGNVYLRFIGDGVYGSSHQTSGSAFFGAVNTNARVTGDVYIEFSAENLVLGSFTGLGYSVMGTHDGTIDGSFIVVVNAGSLTKGILGGSMKGTQVCGKGSKIFVNGGTVGISPNANASIVGGGHAGGVINQGSHITVAGGQVLGSIYGGGIAGTVNEGSNISLSGGQVFGHIYGGGTAGAVNGGSAITIDGTNAEALTLWGHIYGGSNGAGIVAGGSIITISNFTAETLNHVGTSSSIISGAGAGTGAVTGDKILNLVDVVGDFQAQLQNFDRVQLTGTTTVSLTGRNVGLGILDIGSTATLILADLGKLGGATLSGGGKLELTGTSIVLNAQILGTFSGLISITGNNVIRISSLLYDSLGSARFEGILGTNILLVSDLTWINSNTDGRWKTNDSSLTGLWGGGSASQPYYLDGDSVTFNDDSDTQHMISLDGDVAPGATVIGGGFWSFVGSGTLTGTGSLSINAGSLSLGGMTHYAFAGGILLNGGTLLLNGGVFDTAQTVTFGGGSLSVATDIDISTWTFAGASSSLLNVQSGVTVMAGSVIGNRNLDLSGDGVLVINNQARVAAQTLTVNKGATLRIVAGSATDRLDQGNIFAGSGTIEFDLANSQAQTFNASNSFNGSWKLTQGVVRLNPNGMGTYTEKKADAIIMNGGILRIDGEFGANVGFTFTADSEIDATGTLTVQGDMVGGFKLKKTGGGNLILNGNVGTASIEMGAGALSSNKAGGWHYAGDFGVTANVTLGVANGSLMTFSGASSFGNDRSLTINSEVHLTGAVTATGNLTLLGAGKFVFGAYEGATNLAILTVVGSNVHIERDMSIEQLKINKNASGKKDSRLTIASGATVTAGKLTVGQGSTNLASNLDIAGTLKVTGDTAWLGEWNGQQTTMAVLASGSLEILNAVLNCGMGKNEGSNNMVTNVTVAGLAKLKGMDFAPAGMDSGTSSLTLLDGGAIYLGSGGMVKTSTDVNRVVTINLNGGTLGTLSVAEGGSGYTGWSSALAMNLLSAATGTTFDVGMGLRVTLSGALSGIGKLNKTGDGMLELTANNTGFSGNITLGGGTLKASNNALGALANRNITVTGNSSLQSTETNGMIVNSVSVAAGKMLSIGGDGTAQKLTVSSLTLGAGSILRMDILASSQDSIIIAGDGTLTLGAGALIRLDLGVNSGTFTLIDASASGVTITGKGDSGVWNPDIDESALNRGLSAAGQWDGNLYTVVITGTIGAQTVTWNGGDAGTWSAGGTGWTGTGVTDFKNGDSVLFTGTAPGTVTIAGLISPAAITVSAGDYTFAGTGSIIGATTTLTLSGGSLAINNSNTYGGTTTLAGGTLTLGNVAGLGSGAVLFSGGTLKYAVDSAADLGSRIRVATGKNVLIDLNGTTQVWGTALSSAMSITLSNSNTKQGSLSMPAVNLSSANLGAKTTLKLTTAMGTGGAQLILSGAGTLDVANTNNDAQRIGSLAGFTGTIMRSQTDAGAYLHFTTSNTAADRFDLIINGSAQLQSVIIGLDGSFKAGDTLFVRNLSGSRNLTTAFNSNVNRGLNIEMTHDNTFSGSFHGTSNLAARWGTITIGSAAGTHHSFIFSGMSINPDAYGTLGTNAKMLINNATVDLAANAAGTGGGAWFDDIEISATGILKVSRQDATGFVHNQGITGAGKILIAGNATLNAKNTHTGGTEVSSGTLTLGHIEALGANKALLTGGTLHLGAFAVANAIEAASNASQLTGATGYLGDLSILSGASLTLNSALGGTATHSIELKGGSLNMNAQAVARQLKVVGSASLSGNSLFTGNVNLGVGSSLAVSNLTLAQGQNLSIGDLAGNQTATISGNLTLNGGNLSIDWNNTSKGFDSLSMLGTGLLMLGATASTITLDLHSATDIEGGYYLLMQTAGNLVQADIDARLSLAGVANNGRAQYMLHVGDGTDGRSANNLYLWLTAGTAQNLTWTGAETGAEAGLWATGLTGLASNWKGYEANAIRQYYNEDHVIFTALGAGKVTIGADGVAPASTSIEAGAYTFTGGAISAGSLTVKGTGSLILESNNTSTGLLDIQAGFVQFGATSGGGMTSTTGSWLGNIQIALGAKLIVDRSNAGFVMSNHITGEGIFEKTGAGSVTIHSDALNSTVSSFSGGTTVKSGVLVLGSEKQVKGESFQFGSGAISLETGARVSLALTSETGNNYTFTNDWQIKGNSSIYFQNGGGADTLSGNIELLNNASLALSLRWQGVYTLSGQISGSGKLSVELNALDTGDWYGTRTLKLSGANTFTGEIAVTNTHPYVDKYDILLELLLSNAHAAQNAVLNLTSSSVKQRSSLVLDADNISIKGLTSADIWSSVSSTGTTTRILTLNDDVAGLFAGKITGNLGVVKSGSAEWTLSGDNTYTGGTTITAGSIKINHLNALGTTGLITLAGGALDIAVVNFARAITVSSGMSELKGNNLSTYTGALTLSGGTLKLGGSLGAGSGIKMGGTSILNMNGINANRDLQLLANATASLTNHGAYTGNIAFADHATLTVDNSLVFGNDRNLSLGMASTIVGDMNLNGGTINIDLNTSANLWDSLTLEGNLSIGSASTISINMLGAFIQEKEYLLMSYSGSIDTNSFILDIAKGRTVVDLVQKEQGGKFELYLVVGETDFLNWKVNGGGTWQTSVETGHSSGSSWFLNSTPTGGDNNFHLSDEVLFGDQGSGTVTIVGQVQPSVMTVETNSYVFVNQDANSGITGRGTLDVKSGSLTINGANKLWNGLVLMNGGSLTLGNSQALGTGKVMYSSGVLGLASGVNYSITASNFEMSNGNKLTVVLDGSLTLATDTIAGLETLDLSGKNGTLAMTDKAFDFTLNLQEGSSIALTGTTSFVGTTNVRGTASLSGNIGGTLNLIGGSLNLVSGILSNTLHVSGESTLNSSVAASWKSLHLEQGANFTYKTGGTLANLPLSKGQSISTDFGTQVNGSLLFNGGTFTVNLKGWDGHTNNASVLTLNGGSLITLSSTTIDVSALTINDRGEYSFILVKNAGTGFNLGMLELTGTDALNLKDAPVLAQTNGNLTLTLSVVASLRWNGAAESNTWNTNVDNQNWLDSGVATSFAADDFVVFGAEATDKTVTLSGDVNLGALRPTKMTVTEGDYIFTGDGRIIGSGMLMNENTTGTVTFNNAGLNEFKRGIQLKSGSKTILEGSASLAGALDISNLASLTISSSVVSTFERVVGAGNITVDSSTGGGVSIAGFEGGQSGYTGIVTMKQGYLQNNGVQVGSFGDMGSLKAKSVHIEAKGDVILAGVKAAHLGSLQTTVAGAQISGLTGSISLAGAKFTLSEETKSKAVINFSEGKGSLDMGSLELDMRALAFLDTALTHNFVITNGTFGTALSTINTANGIYENFKFTSYLGAEKYAVMGINGGTITIGGTKAYSQFVLDVNNQWTPHIASTESASFTAAQFKTFAGTDFQSVTVDGRLRLLGKDAFTLNLLAGGFTGEIFILEEVKLTIDGSGDQPFAGRENIYEGTLSAGRSDVEVIGTQSLLGMNYMKTLTLAQDAKLTLGGYTRLEGKDVTTGTGIVREALTLGTGSILTLAAGSETLVNGEVKLGTGSTLQGEGLLKILAGGDLSLDAGSLVSGSVIIELEKSADKSGSLNIGSGSLTLGGITGSGKVNSSGGTIILNVSENLSFDGLLTGTGTAELPSTGNIVKTGTGEQILNATTDKHNIYNLNVQEGTLVVKGKDVTYGDIVVNSPIPVTGKSTRAATVPPASGSYLVIDGKVNANSLLVEQNAQLTIGSATGKGASLSLTGMAEFVSHSKIEVYASSGSSALISASEILGLSGIDSLTVNATTFWQANINLVLFHSETVITDKLNEDKVILSGFGDKNIIYTDGGKTITINASRGFDDNPFRQAMAGAGQNALAGMDLIWDANVRAGEQGGNLDSNSTLASVFNSLVMMGSGTEGANRLMAAVAGSTVTALAASQRDDFRQQQDWIRNRTVGMGISADVVHEDLPYVNGWIQANAGTNRISDNGDEAGYNLNTFGGTFGFDVDMSTKTTWGFAFTANYNKLTANGAESAKGRNDAYYANLFLRTQNKRWANTFILTGGWNDAKLDRTVSAPGVSYVTQGTTQGSTFGAMYETTYDYALNENKTSILQPLLNLSFSSATMDAYTEEGAGNAGLHVDESKNTYGTIAIGARLLGTVGENLFGRSAMGELRLQVAQDIGDDANTANVGLGGIQREVIGTKVGKTALQLGAGISIPVTEQGAIYMDVNTDFRSNATNVNGSIGYRINF